MKEDNPANSISHSFKLTTPKNLSLFFTQFFRLFPLLTFLFFILSCGNLPSDLGGTSDTTAPSAPNVVSASAGNEQVTISWNSVSGATSYNIYWSTTSGVTKTNGTKITSATSPYTHSSLTNSIIYYM